MKFKIVIYTTAINMYEFLARQIYKSFPMLQVVEGPDRFVVCGPTYTDIREALTRVVLGEGLDKLQDKIQVWNMGVALAHIFMV